MIPSTNDIATLSALTDKCRFQQHRWSVLPVRRRLEPVRAFRRLLVEKCDSLCASTANDIGKPAQETIGAEILPLAEACRFLERQACRLLKPRRVPISQRPLWLWGQSDVVYRRPRGLVGIIGTWNYPLLLNGVQILQALTAGNAVLWKPSEVAPSCADVLQDLIHQAGFPDGLFGALPATREAGKQLADADIDHMIFTGSAVVGRALAEHLGKRLVSSTLELSGCDAQFVLDDADIDLAARAAWFGATVNRGQTCLAVRRAFVQRGVYQAFLRALQPLVNCGRINWLALAAQARLAGRLVRQALSEGARLLNKDSQLPADDGSAACAPLVVVDARPEMDLCREAPFAPVLAVIPFDTEQEALAMDGQCDYALGASVFTRRPARAERLARHLRVGMVAVNDVIAPTAHPATPFGGRGASGWGVTQGAEGLLEMTVPQVVSLREGRFRPHFDMALGSPSGQDDLMRAVLESGHASSLRKRASGWMRLVRCLLRTD